MAGRVEREGQVVHLIAERIEDLSPMLLILGKPSLSESSDNQPDAARHPANTANRSSTGEPGEQVKKLFKARILIELEPACAFRGSPPGDYTSAAI